MIKSVFVGVAGRVSGGTLDIVSKVSGGLNDRGDVGRGDEESDEGSD